MADDPRDAYPVEDGPAEDRAMLPAALDEPVESATERHTMTVAALDDVDAVSLVDHEQVLAWANRLESWGGASDGRARPKQGPDAEMAGPAAAVALRDDA